MSEEIGQVVVLANGNGEVYSQESASDVEKIKSFLAEKLKGVPKKKMRAAIFSHATPDPDAIGSQIGMKHLLFNAYGLDCDLFFDGKISHPQNKAAVQLLDPHLNELCNYKDENYCLKVLVDTVPDNAGIGSLDVSFDIVVDHHKDLPGINFNGLCIHHHTGSASSIVYNLIKGHDIVFDVINEEHSKIASAILVGVLTDTRHCTSPDTTRWDFEAQQDLFKFRDDDAIRKIVYFNWPMSWIKLKGAAIQNAVIEEGVAVVGLGSLSSEQKDVIAEIATDMLTWGNVQTAIVFALFDGDRIQGSVRTNDDTIEIHAVCQKLGGAHGKGGGKSCAGGYTKYLGSFELDPEEDDKLKSKLWEVLNEREIAKVFKVMKK